MTKDFSATSACHELAPADGVFGELFRAMQGLGFRVLGCLLKLAWLQLCKGLTVVYISLCLSLYSYVSIYIYIYIQI